LGSSAGREGICGDRDGNPFQSALLAGSAHIGRRSAGVMSLTQGARRNGHGPYAYLRDVLERLPLTPAHRLEELLTHCWKPAHAPRLH
jgi:hypothetical protein